MWIQKFYGQQPSYSFHCSVYALFQLLQYRRHLLHVCLFCSVTGNVCTYMCFPDKEESVSIFTSCIWMLHYWNIFLTVLQIDAPCASGNRLGNLANIEENWPAVCWQIQAGGPHWKGKQLVNHLPENMQMAANDSGLIDRWLLFAQKNTPGLSKRAKSPQFPENPNSSVMFLLQVSTVQLCFLRFFLKICFHNLT